MGGRDWKRDILPWQERTGKRNLYIWRTETQDISIFMYSLRIELPRVAYILFSVNPYGMFILNVAALGIKHIVEGPVNIRLWKNVHPRISDISKDLYREGHSDSAAGEAVKEVESILRELFTILIAVPAKAGEWEFL